MRSGAAKPGQEAPQQGANKPATKQIERNQADKIPPERAVIQAMYPTAEDAVRKPERFAATSHYFVDRWLPDLGPTAAAIILYLRRCGYYNPRTGELRNEISRSQQEIGDGIGVSERTVRREFAENPRLPFFIQVLPSFEQNARGHLHKVRSIYRVMMTDPVHPADADLVVQEGARLAAERAEAQKARVRVKRVKTDDGPRAEGIRRGQNGLYGLEYRRGQNGRALDSDSDEITSQENTSTLSVGEGSTFVAGSEQDAEVGPVPAGLRSKRTQMLDKLVAGLVAELHDFGSERRHHQLLDICQQRNLDELPRQALAATRRRLASEGALGPLEKPGAYYHRVLLALLEDHQVFVPKLGEADPEEVHRLAMQSLKDADKNTEPEGRR